MQLVLNGIDVFHPLEGKMDAIIDSFVSVYGEKYRPIITKKITEAKKVFVPRLNFNTIGRELDSYYFKQENSLKNSLLKDCGLDKQQLKLFSACTLSQLFQLKQELHTKQFYTSQFTLPKILALLGEKNIDASEKGLQQHLQNPETKKKVENFIEKLQRTYNKNGYSKKLEKLNKEHAFACSQVYDSDKKIEALLKKHQDEKTAIISPILEAASGKKIDEATSFFQINNYQELLALSDKDRSKDNDLPNYSKSQIVKFLKTCGIPESSYEEMIEHPIVQNILLSPQAITQIRDLEVRQKNEIATTHPHFLDVLKEIESINPQCGTLPFVKTSYRYMNDRYGGGALVSTYVDKHTHEGTAILFCPWALEGQDTTIIHELGHIFETSCVSETDTEATIKCGLDYSTESKKEENFNGHNLDLDDNTNQPNGNEKRHYEILNEVIHEFLAMEVTQNLHKKGVTLTLESQRDGSETSYARCFPLMATLIDEHKELLIDSVMSNDPKYLEKAIGTKNVETLANECYSFYVKTNPGTKLIRFLSELKQFAQANNCTLTEAIYKENDWSSNTTDLIECIKKVHGVRREMQQLKEDQEENE